MAFQISIVCWTLMVAAQITAVFTRSPIGAPIVKPSACLDLDLNEKQYEECLFLHRHYTNDTKDVYCFKPSRALFCIASKLCCIAESDDDMNEETSETGIRYQRDVTRQGCGWQNENGVVENIARTIPDGYAKPGEFPWMVNIVRLNSSGSRSGYLSYIYVGGGFLINEKVVLTAAHVIVSEETPSRLYAVVGNYDGDSDSPLPKVLKKVDTYDIHEQYRQGAYSHDIAMIVLRKPVKWMLNMGYICLPPLNAQVTPGSLCFTSGWGKNSDNEHNYVMAKAEIPVLTRDTCRSMINSGNVNQSVICAGGEVGKDTCKGDGGSPLACPIEGQPGRYMASGVLSFRMSCGLDGKPSVYIEVARYRQWIDDKMLQYGFPIDSYTQY